MAGTDLAQAFGTFTRSILSKEPGICVIRQEYLQMGARQVVDQFSNKLDILYAAVIYMNVSQLNRRREVLYYQ